MTANQQLAKALWNAADFWEREAEWDSDFGYGGPDSRKQMREKAEYCRYKAACLDPERKFKEEI